MAPSPLRPWPNFPKLTHLPLPPFPLNPLAPPSLQRLGQDLNLLLSESSRSQIDDRLSLTWERLWNGERSLQTSNPPPIGTWWLVDGRGFQTLTPGNCVEATAQIQRRSPVRRVNSLLQHCPCPLACCPGTFNPLVHRTLSALKAISQSFDVKRTRHKRGSDLITSLSDRNRTCRSLRWRDNRNSCEGPQRRRRRGTTSGTEIRQVAHQISSSARRPRDGHTESRNLKGQFNVTVVAADHANSPTEQVELFPKVERPRRLIAGNWQWKSFRGQSPVGKWSRHKVQVPTRSQAKRKIVLSRQMGLCSRKDRQGRTSWSLSPAPRSLSKVAPLASSLEITAITPFQTCNHIVIYIYSYIYI